MRMMRFHSPTLPIRLCRTPSKNAVEKNWRYFSIALSGLLPPETRRIVEMCHLLELPQSEVAERLGISVGALQARLHRARRQLLQVLHGPLYRRRLHLPPLRNGRTMGSGWTPGCGVPSVATGYRRASLRPMLKARKPSTCMCAVPTAPGGTAWMRFIHGVGLPWPIAIVQAGMETHHTGAV